MNQITTGPRVPADSPSVLLVDDEIRILNSLKYLLEKQGYVVDTAQGGLSAKAKLSLKKYDVVLLDLIMRDISGQQLMQHIAENKIDTAVIVISVETTFAVVSHALRKGAFDYLRKPFSIEELTSSIKRVLEKKHQQREQQKSHQRLHKARQLQRHVLNTSPDIVFILDRHGCFNFLNKAVERIVGFRTKDLLGQHFRTVLTARELVKHRDSITAVQQGMSVKDIEVTVYSDIKNTTRRHFEVTLLPIYQHTFNDLNHPADQPQIARPHSTEKPDTQIIFKEILGQDQHKHDNGEQVIGVYGNAKDITSRKEAQEYVQFQAYHDLLTRLPNRRLFNDRLHMAIAHSRRHNKQLAVLFLDLDRFKLVNDTLGHTLGDHLLKSVAARLQNCLREGDTLSRFGGDEFVLLLPVVKDRDAAGEVAQKIINSIKEPFIVEQNEVSVGITIGIAMYPIAGTDMQHLVQHADIAMYHAKKNGKGQYQFFSQAMLTNVTNRLEITNELHQALSNDEFKVYYQPQLRADNGGIIGLEALIRWHHPQRGVLHPAQFIGLAEESNLLADISEWVLRTACQQVKHWIDVGYSHIKLSVNMASSQLDHPELAITISSLLRQIGFPPGNLELELTERMIMSDQEPLITKLKTLSDSGVTIAIDDFGTGSLSLNWLRKLPIHTLKVDQSFVHDIENNNTNCVVSGIIAMAQGMKFNIIAEGVETEHQLNYLKKLGCQQFQGFFFAEAKPADDITNLLDKNILDIVSAEQ